MFPFLHFLQLLTNWPKMLEISWNNVVSPSYPAISIRIIDEKIPEIWNSANNVRQRVSIVDLSICSKYSDLLDNSSYQWEVYRENHLEMSIMTRNCSIEVSITSQEQHSIQVSRSSHNITQVLSMIEIPKSKVQWIAAVGDSFSSGQGNPDFARNSKRKAKWLNDDCYRSSKAFPYQLLKSLRNETCALTFLSCSGSTIAKGVLSQLDLVEELIKVRGEAPSVLFMTIGGNDVGFSDVMDMLHRGESRELQKSLEMRFLYVSHQLDLLEMKLAALRIPKIVVVGYYDITRNERSQIDGSCLGKFAEKNFEFAERNIFQRLNTILRKKAGKSGWIFVPTADIFANSGICSSQSLIRTDQESQNLQGNYFGNFHPTEEAHSLIANRLIHSVFQK